MLAQITTLPEEIEEYDLLFEKTQGLEEHYVASGTRLFMMGDQNGGFPPLGYHIPGEMGGVWIYAVKLLDGFWMKVTVGVMETWVDKADKFVVGPGFCEHYYTLADMGISITRRELVPDEIAGLVVEYHFKNDNPESVTLHIDFVARVNLRPSWLSEQLQIGDGNDEVRYDKMLDAIIGEDVLNHWGFACGASVRSTGHRVGQDVVGPELSYSQKGSGGELSYELKIAPKQWEHLTFYFGGGMNAVEEAKAAFREVKDKHTLFLDEKVASYKFQSSFSIPSCPNEALEHAFNGAKMNYLMLQAKITGVGAGVVGGFPELPWFSVGDFAFGAIPMLAVGQFEAVRDTLILFNKYAHRFCHGEDLPQEITALGSPFMRENLTRFPLFVSALRNYMDWTGDMETVSQLYPLATQLLKMVQQERRGIGLLPSGKGLIDKPGFDKKMVDVASYLAEGLKDLMALAAGIGERLNYQQLMERKYQEAAYAARGFWLEQAGLFADIIASQADLETAREDAARKSYLLKPDQVREKIKIKAMPADAYVDDEGKPLADTAGNFLGLFKHWTIVVPLEVGLADPRQAEKALSQLTGPEFLGKFGMYLQSEMDRRGVALASSLLASALARYGKLDKALEVIDAVCATLPMAMPGAICEYLPNAGNFLHLSSTYALVRVFVHYIMGIRPCAPSKSIEFIPDLPTGWDSISLKNVRIMSNLYDFKVSLSRNHGQISIQSTEHGFTGVMGIPTPKDGKLTNVIYRGMSMRVWDYQDVTANDKRYIVITIPLSVGDNSFRIEWE